MTTLPQQPDVPGWNDTGVSTPNRSFYTQVLDRNGRVVSATHAGNGFPPRDIPWVAGNGWLDPWSGGDREAAEHALSEVLAGRSTRFYGACCDRRGMTRQWDIELSPLYDGDGRIAQLLAVACDSEQDRGPERHLANRQGHSPRDRFDGLAQCLPDVAWVADEMGQMRHFSHRWHALTGLPAAQSLGDGWVDAVEPSCRQPILRSWRDACRNDRTFEAEVPLFCATDQTYRWHLSRARPICGSDGGIIAWVGSHTDIHDIREAAAALRLSEMRYRSLVTSSAGIVWSCTSERKFSVRAPSWEQYTGQSFADCRDLNWRVAVHPDDIDDLEALWDISMRKLQMLETRCRIKRHDGMWRVNLLRGVPVMDAKGSVLEWVCTAVDIHDKHEAQQQLELAIASERAARSEAERIGRIKDEFLTTLSHELRTPLNAIFGWTQILKHRSADTAAVSRGVDVIDRNVRLQARLIEDLLDLSGIISGKTRLERKPVALEGIIDAAIASAAPLAAEKGLRIDKEPLPAMQLLNADANRLQQVFWNLLSNAVKFTPAGGVITCCATVADDQVTVSVIDNGEGIAPEFLPRVFERFSQGDASIKRRHGGLGVGLSIVKNYVDMHGGTVRAESTGPGQGAAFHVTLPHAAAAASHESANIALQERQCVFPLEGTRILVIDDEADARELLQRLLEEHGAVTCQASSADDAYGQLDRFEADLILCDIGMPVVDGYQFMQTLRSRGVTTPAAALTAFARDEDRQRCLLAGFQRHLAKPFDAFALFSTIANLTGRH